MSKIILLLIQLIIVSGSIVISQFYIIYWLKKEKSIYNLLILLINVFLIAFLNYINLLLLYDTSHNNTGIVYSITLLKISAMAILVYSIINYFHNLMGIGKKITFLFKLISAGLIINLILIFPSEILYKSASKPIFNSYIRVIYISALLAYLYSTGIVLLNFRKIKNRIDRKHTLITLSTALVIPLFYILKESGLLKRFFTYPQIEYDFIIISFNLCYFIWLIFTFFYGFDCLRKSQSPKSDNMNLNNLKYNSRLSLREQEILDLLIEGLANKDIADSLSVSLSTIKTHTNRIYQKTKTANRIELINKVHGGINDIQRTKNKNTTENQ